MDAEEVVTRNDNGDMVDEHPAFGMVSLSRISSTGMLLAGSSVKHGNYIRLEIKDWLRNSIQMLAQSLYSQKELHGKKNDALHEMCWQKGFNWAKQPGECKNGTLFTKTSEGIVKHTEFNLMDDDFCQKIFGEFI